jgi:DNA anti-recombination protein RmuC
MYELEMSDQDMEQKTSDLSAQFHRAPKDQREDLRKQMSDLVSKHFDVRQQRRKLQLSRLEQELKRMRDEIEGRNDKRADIVNRRLHELLGEKSDLDF